ncbi:uncharacterized protein LOC124364547 [Homalodisca vitripennis]|uniref:uncharacterized protein LOC124364547 n=1 Tax=Homalodisca vitripennis TaxID=197043 RepID=UPI001EEABDA7|nr:uncharacterized protein LOC124364547 [Homalodisca vitripennis]
MSRMKKRQQEGGSILYTILSVKAETEAVMTLQRSGLEYNCNGKNENLKTLRIFPVVIEDVSINKTTLQFRFIRHLNLCQRSLDYVYPRRKIIEIQTTYWHRVLKSPTGIN